MTIYQPLQSILLSHTNRLYVLFHCLRKSLLFALPLVLSVSANLSSIPLQVFSLMTALSLPQAGRTRRSHAEEESQETPQGSIGRTTPAVSASDRRKSLKLVRWGGGKKDVVQEERVDACLESPVSRLSFSNRWNKRKVRLGSPFSPQDCLLGSARCVLFQCPLHRFSGQAVLKVHARLWNSSFIEARQTSQQRLPSRHPEEQSKTQ